MPRGVFKANGKSITCPNWQSWLWNYVPYPVHNQVEQKNIAHLSTLHTPMHVYTFPSYAVWMVSIQI